MDYWHFMTSRNIANRMGQLDSQLVILRDKFMFYTALLAVIITACLNFIAYKDKMMALTHIAMKGKRK